MRHDSERFTLLPFASTLALSGLFASLSPRREARNCSCEARPVGFGDKILAARHQSGRLKKKSESSHFEEKLKTWLRKK